MKLNVDRYVYAIRRTFERQTRLTNKFFDNFICFPDSIELVRSAYTQLFKTYKVRIFFGKNDIEYTFQYIFHRLPRSYVCPWWPQMTRNRFVFRCCSACTGTRWRNSIGTEKRKYGTRRPSTRDRITFPRI